MCLPLPTSLFSLPTPVVPGELKAVLLAQAKSNEASESAAKINELQEGLNRRNEVYISRIYKNPLLTSPICPPHPIHIPYFPSGWERHIIYPQRHDHTGQCSIKGQKKLSPILLSETPLVNFLEAEAISWDVLGELLGHTLGSMELMSPSRDTLWSRY